MRAGVMVNIATGANAEAFAKHWRAVCANSIMPDARGKVQTVPGVPGGQQCVTAKGSSKLLLDRGAGPDHPGRTGERGRRLGEDPPAASGGSRALRRAVVLSARCRYDRILSASATRSAGSVRSIAAAALLFRCN
jgi:hypothetical protein